MNKDLTIVIVTYKQPEKINVILHSLFCQTMQNFKILVIHDGYDKEMNDVLSQYTKKYSDIFSFMFTPIRHNDFGHTLRDVGIKFCDTEYILITNGDNYYCPLFIEYMFEPINQQKQVEKSVDIVMCDMVHSHFWPGGRLQDKYCFFETFPSKQSVDIGCFISKSATAKLVGFHDNKTDGDGTYFEDLLAHTENPNIVKINKILFVHN